MLVWISLGFYGNLTLLENRLQTVNYTFGCYVGLEIESNFACKKQGGVKANSESVTGTFFVST